MYTLTHIMLIVSQIVGINICLKYFYINRNQFEYAFQKLYRNKDQIRIEYNIGRMKSNYKENYKIYF